MYWLLQRSRGERTSSQNRTGTVDLDAEIRGYNNHNQDLPLTPYTSLGKAANLSGSQFPSL